MKVLLINPPRFHELIGKNPAIVEKHRGFNPPLGILSLAGYLERHTDHEIRVIDAQPLGWGYGELKEDIARTSFDVCGITAMTFTLVDVIQTCRVVCEVNPKCKIVLGGAHVHLFPDETIRMPEVDFLIQGEGEIAFVDLLEKLDRPAFWQSVPGLVYVDAAGKVTNNGVSPSTKDLDTLGFPARHMLDAYRRHRLKEVPPLPGGEPRPAEFLSWQADAWVATPRRECPGVPEWAQPSCPNS